MNRLLYVAPVPIDFNNLDGVPKKILCQAKALQDKFDVDVISYFDGNVFVYNIRTEKKNVIGKAGSKLSVIKTAMRIVTGKVYNCTYIRYPRSDYFFLKMLKAFKRENMSIVVEIPTYPYDKEGFETTKGKIINILDRIYRKKLHKYVDRIVTFSKDKEIFGINTINTINGIDFNSTTYDIADINTQETIYLIAVSAMFRVHGYERLIEGLNEYYTSGGNRNIVLKLVGKGDECPKYKELVKKYSLEDHVIFFGARFGKELSEIYKGNAVGINSLAIHRQGLKEESTLKTKEYAAKGLPILSSSYVDAFSTEGNKKYVLRVSSDEKNIDVYQLINFVDSIYGKMSIEKIRNMIREDGEKTCDIKITMKPVLSYLTNH